MHCSKCGSKIEIGSDFCIKCGYEFRNDQEFINANKFSDEVTFEELRLFVRGQSEEYYILKWQKFKGTKCRKYISWDWGAFAISFFWMAYRKMYVQAIVLGSMTLIIMEMAPKESTRFIDMLLSIIIGMFGNRAYCDHAQKQIIKVKNSISDLSEQRKAIADKGGTNILFAVIYLVVYFGIAVICETVKYL